VLAMRLYGVIAQPGTRKVGLMLGVIAALGFYLCFSVFTFTSSRFINMQKSVTQKSDTLGNSTEGSNERLSAWVSSLSLIREHPVLGVGTGDVKDELLATYGRNHYMTTLTKKLNSHNQYLQTYLSTGIAGFLTLAAMLAAPAFLAFRRKRYLYLSFILLFALNLLFESMLETQAGVVFYAFFNTFLFWDLIREEDVLGF